MSDEPLLQARKGYIENELQRIYIRLTRLRDDLREAEAGLPSVQIQEEIDGISEKIIKLRQESENLRDLKINQEAIRERLAKIPKAIEALQRERTAGVELLRHMRSKETTGDETKDAIISKETNL